MNVVKEIQRINEREIERSDYSESASWHAQYKNTAWIFAGNMPFDLTEGDIICIFSQYGEIMNMELIRDKDTGKSKGFAFLQYEDQRSTVLAVDNLNGSNVLGRTLRVDHSYGPKPRRIKQEDGSFIEEPYVPTQNVAPKMIEVSESEARAATAAATDDYDAEDPMAAYFRDKARKKSDKKNKSKKKKKEKRHRSSRHHSDVEEEDHRRSTSRSRHDRPNDNKEESSRRRSMSRSPSPRKRDRRSDSEEDYRRRRSPSPRKRDRRSDSEEDYRRRRSPSPRKRDRRSDSEEDYRHSRRRRSPSPSRRDRYDDDDRRRRRRRDY